MKKHIYSRWFVLLVMGLAVIAAFLLHAFCHSGIDKFCGFSQALANTNMLFLLPVFLLVARWKRFVRIVVRKGLVAFYKTALFFNLTKLLK
jgi:hypothetical protein